MSKVLKQNKNCAGGSTSEGLRTEKKIVVLIKKEQDLKHEKGIAYFLFSHLIFVFCDQ